MKRLLFILILLSSANLFGQANGTITAVSIDTGGWDAYITIKGFTDVGTWTANLGTNNNPSTAYVVFTVTSPGYTTNASTTNITRTVYGTRVVRLPYPAVWAATTSYALNNAVSDGTYYQKVIACSGTCTSAGSHCTWATVVGNTCVDNAGANQITWENIGLLPTSNPIINTGFDENIATAGQMTIRVALSDYIYSVDTVTVSITSGFYLDSKTGGTGINNLVATGLTVTNNSTLSYSSTVPICTNGWPGFERVVGDFPVEALCFSHFGQNGSEVAAVTFTATDAHSHSVSVTVSKMGLSYYSRSWTNAAVQFGTIAASGPGDQEAVAAYDAVIPTSSFTAGDQITVYHQAFPWVGNSTAIFNSSVGSNGVAQPSPLVGPIYEIYDPSNSYGTSFVHVKTGGATTCSTHVKSTRALAEADATGLASISFAASCLEAYNNTTFSRADAGGGMILLDAGNWATGNGSNYALGTMKTWMILDKVSTLTASQVAITSQNDNFPDSDGNTLFKWQNITLGPTSNNFAYGANAPANDSLWLHNVSVSTTNANPFNHMPGVMYATQSNFILNASGFNPASAGGTAAFGWGLIRGNYCAPSNGAQIYAIVGNVGGCAPLEVAPSTTTLSDGGIFAFNYIFNYQNGSNAGVGQTAAVNKGYALVQNVIENTSYAGTNFAIASPAGAGPWLVNNMVIQHNSTIGTASGAGTGTYGMGRTNFGYDSSGSSVDPRTNWGVQFNNWSQRNIKTDSFGTPNGARIGNWPIVYGCGIIGDVTQASTADIIEPPEFSGIGGSLNLNPQYINDITAKIASGTPAGTLWLNGYYGILSTSADIGLSPFTTTANEPLPFDLNGALRTCPVGVGCTTGAYLYNVGDSVARTSTARGSVIR